MEDLEEGFEDVDLHETVRRLTTELRTLRQEFNAMEPTQADLNARNTRRRRLNPLTEHEGSGDEGPESQEGHKKRQKALWKMVFILWKLTTVPGLAETTFRK